MASAATPAPSPAAADASGWVTVPVAAAAAVAPTSLRCWWEPARGDRCRGGVLVLPEVFGVNGWVRGMAGRLAAEGYAALAMPLFSRTAPELDLPYDAASLAEGRHHKDQTTTAQILADGAAALLAGREAAAGRGRRQHRRDGIETLESKHLLQPAVVGNIGGLAGPGGYGPRSRHDQPQGRARQVPGQPQAHVRRAPAHLATNRRSP